MTDYQAFARQLITGLSPEIRDGLGASPKAVIEGLGIRVQEFDTFTYLDGDCSCDGIYAPGPPTGIGYRPTPRSRRDLFTLNHEFAHHAIRQDGQILSELADIDDDGGKGAEERICDAFAGLVLIPDDTTDLVLGDEKPFAHHVGDLYEASSGSREACAVRLAERIPGFGYMAIADPADKSIRFASPSASNPYPWRRGTELPNNHPMLRAAEKGEYRGQGPVVWPSGERRELWIDAVSYRNEVHAVLVDNRYWTGSGVSVLDGGVRTARSTAYSGTCPHCGAHTWGYRLHEVCGELWCRSCNRCSCDAPERFQPEERTCQSCGQRKRANLFAEGTVDCIDCQ